jgi:hypothetical protein
LRIKFRQGEFALIFTAGPEEFFGNLPQWRIRRCKFGDARLRYLLVFLKGRPTIKF